MYTLWFSVKSEFLISIDDFDYFWLKDILIFDRLFDWFYNFYNVCLIGVGLIILIIILIQESMGKRIEQFSKNFRIFLMWIETFAILHIQL